MTLQLNPPIPVSITSDSLPPGVQATSRRGWCYAWKDTGIDGHRLWVVVLDETGEVVDTPQPEVRVDPNWSHGRRPRKADVRDLDVGDVLNATEAPRPISGRPEANHKCEECGYWVEENLGCCLSASSTCPSMKK
jgi:hypothetical protein